MTSENQYLPPLVHGQRLPPNTTAVESVHAWLDLMRAADKLLYARFVDEVGAEEALPAYRTWLNQQAERHSRHVEAMMRRVNAIEETNGP